MLAQIAAIFKGILEFLGIAKFFYGQFQKTPEQKNDEIDAKNAEEKKKEQTTGRPSS